MALHLAATQGAYKNDGSVMKKRKPHVQKREAFASRPFTPLKGISAVPKSEPPKLGKPPTEPEIPTDDAELFLRAMADTKKLRPARGKSEERKIGHAPSRLDEEERSLFLRALENLQLDVSFRDELPGAEAPPKPLGGNRLRQLKQGAIRLDFQLDLHGLTRDEALQGLEYFIVNAQKRGQKAVLVITGRGNHSSGEPVLQGAVTAWLRVKGKAMVAEFAPAPREMGGAGAFVVFLREKVTNEES